MKLFAIETKGKWGFINRRGKVIIPPRFDSVAGVEVFPPDMVIFSLRTPPRFDSEIGFKSGLALIKDKGRVGFIDRKGEMIFSLPSGMNHAILSDGLVRMKIGKFTGFLSKDGRLVVAPEFLFSKDFTEGLAAVLIGGRVKSRNGFRDVVGGLWGYIDKSGRMKVTPKYKDAGYFSESLAWVKVGKKYGYIDKKGRIVIKPLFKYADSFHQGRAVVRLRGSKDGYIDRSGKLICKPQFSFANDFHDGLAAVCVGGKAVKGDFIGGKWGFVDRAGKMVIKPQFDGIYGGWVEMFKPPFSEGLAAVNIGGKNVNGQFKGGKWGFINRRGKWVVEPKFKSAVNFSGGLAAVKIGRKWGYISKRSGTVIAPQFRRAGDFSCGLARVEIDKKRWSYIEK